MRKTALFMLAALWLTAAPLASQTVVERTAEASSTRGLFLGLHLNGSAISMDEPDTDMESGGGFGLQLGYGFTPRLAVVLDGTGAMMSSSAGDYSLGHFDIALRYAFTHATRRFAPFLEVGYSGRAAVQDDVTISAGGYYGRGDLSISGTGLTLGGGAQYYLSPRVALGAGLKWTTGEFSTVKFDNVSVDGLELDATSTRFNVGLTWYPMAGR